VATIQFTDRGAAVRVSGESAALARAATAARHAPSILTSQPWRWRVDGRVLELRADRSRQITTRDPDARMLTLSCGAALHHARIALAAEGIRIQVDNHAQPTDPDLLATITHLGHDATPDPAALRTYRAIAVLPRWALDQLRVTAAHAGAHLQFISNRAMTSLALANSATPAEPTDTGAHYGTISTTGDVRHDWLTAGQALSAVLLTATADGLATSVTTNAVENPHTRTLLRQALHTTSHPAAIVRIGLPANGPSDPVLVR
jgi:hypothetical protein